MGQKTTEEEEEALVDESLTEDERDDLRYEHFNRMAFAQEETQVDFARVVIRVIISYVLQMTVGSNSKQSKTDLEKLYSRTDEENKKLLEENDVGIDTLVGVMHMMMSWANVFSSDPKPKVSHSTNEAKRAVIEVYLILELLGSCHSDGHYSKKKQGMVEFEYDGKGECRLPIPGIDINQLDKRNQAVLHRISPILDVTSKDELPQYSREVTERGLHGSRPKFCFGSPVYMVGGWTVSACEHLCAV